MSLLEQVHSLPPYQWAAGLKRSLIQARREGCARVLFQLPPRPVPELAPERASLHVLTSRRDWLGALWSVRTFLDFLGESLPIRFHDDGTLTPAIAERIMAFLPGAVVITAAQAQAEMERRLRDFPQCQAARRRHIMTHKLLDAAVFAPGARYLLLDSDLLFFSRPAEIAHWLTGSERANLWGRDAGNFLNLTKAEAQTRFGVNLAERVNAGFGCVWRESVDFSLLEEFFGLESVWCHPHRVEQTAYALLSSRFGVRLLPRAYLLDTNRACGLPTGIVMKHYVGKIRDLFFSEGIGHLRAHGFLSGAL
jgi:hypothetical protein